MGRRSDHSREEIREMALKAARSLVEKKGYQGLTARKVAKEIGYTVGTLYLVFENLDDLIVALNTETVTELRLELETSGRACKTERERIPALAKTYIDYALQYPHRWRLAFEHRLPEGRPPPQAVTNQTDALFAMVADYLGVYSGGRSEEEIAEIATALWSGIHGVCILALTDKLKFGSGSSLYRLATILIDNLLAGLEATSAGPD